MRAIRIAGFKVKGNKVVRSDCHLSVSERLRQKDSKRVRPAR
jgi:hypothetical protein